jgi:hypothetical protein
MNLTNKKAFHILMSIVVVILGFNVLEALLRHHWLLFLIWILLPPIMLWLSGDIMRANFSLESLKNIRRTLVGIAFFLSIFNLINSINVEHSLGKEFIQGYRLIQSYDCDVPEGYSSNKSCLVEDLSQVSWYGVIIVHLMQIVCTILALIFPLLTWYAGKEGLIKKEDESRISNY